LAIQLVFTKFAELQSARQVHIRLRDKGIELPAKSRRGKAQGVVWRLPAYSIVHNILTTDLCRCLCVRTNDEPDQRGGRPQARTSWRTPADGRMERADQGSSCRLHHLGRVRTQPQSNANNATGMSSALSRGAARRRTAAARASALRPLRQRCAEAVKRRTLAELAVEEFSNVSASLAGLHEQVRSARA
jgi:hypothetical protein